jgi:hypothetical protein
MSYKYIALSCVLTIFGHVFIWFQANSQYVWQWWKDHTLLSVFIFSLPAGLCFFYGWTFAVQEFNSVWSARLIGFALSFTVFPVLTWYLLNESMFRPKVLICVGLAVCILLVQLFYPEN